METPRRYYPSDVEYQEGKTASAAAWENWKNKRFPGSQISRSSFFELLDRDLKETNRLIQSGDGVSFDRGVERLQERIDAAKDANDRRHEAARIGRWLSSKETAYYLNRQRKAPSILELILEQLQSPSKRFKAKQQLAQLCDDGEAARTINMAPTHTPTSYSPSHQTTATSSSQTHNYVPSRPPTHHAQTTTGIGSIATTSRPQQQTIHPKGEAFGLGHDPGEQQGATVIQGNMYEKSTAPTRRPVSSSRNTNIPSRHSSTRRNTASRQTTQHPQTLRSSKYVPTTSWPEKKTTVHPKGEAFGLGHDPGEQGGATVTQGNMYASSDAPNRKPIITSRSKKQRRYRRNSDQQPSGSNPLLPSYVKTHDFAYEGA
jgi:hypothetical protein